MANNNFPLQTLLDLSNARRDDAARKLGQLVASEQAGAQKLALLTQYRDEYHQRFLDAAREGLNRDQWSNYQAFLAPPDQHVGQQQAALDSSHRRTADGQRAWLDQRNKAKAFDTLSASRSGPAAVGGPRRAEDERRTRRQDDATARPGRRSGVLSTAVTMSQHPGSSDWRAAPGKQA